MLPSVTIVSGNRATNQPSKGQGHLLSCCGQLKIVIKNSHQKLSSKIVIKNCHHKLSSKIVIKNCHQQFSSKIVINKSDQMSQRSKQWIVLCSKIKRSVSEWVSEWVTRSPIELFWTAKNRGGRWTGGRCSKKWGGKWQKKRAAEVTKYGAADDRTASVLGPMYICQNEKVGGKGWYAYY